MSEDTTRPEPGLAHNPGLGVFYTAMFILGIILLILLPIQTESGPVEQGWWTQPILMPAISIWLFAITATILFFQHIIKVRRSEMARPSGERIRVEIFQWFKPVEYFVYYVAYIWLLGMVGYFLSSLIFIIGVGLRVGLRSPRWLLNGLLFAVLLIAVFRWGLQVWVPAAELYELFEKDTRIFLMRNF